MHAASTYLHMSATIASVESNTFKPPRISFWQIAPHATLAVEGCRMSHGGYIPEL